MHAQCVIRSKFPYGPVLHQGEKENIPPTGLSLSTAEKVTNNARGTSTAGFRFIKWRIDRVE